MLNGAAIAGQLTGTARASVPPPVRGILTWPLPELGAADRMLLRAAAILTRSCVRSVLGLENIAVARDPFILALNHSSRGEVLVVPPLLFLLRHGRRIHFLADWNFRMIPGMALLYRRSGAITVPYKPARPRMLEILKPLFTDAAPPFERAREILRAGHSVGIFPEGTVNRDHRRLLRGRPGAARLSLETGAPVVPVGLRFPESAPGEAIPFGSPMEIDIGAPLDPAFRARTSDARSELWQWHAEIMAAIGHLSGKAWQLDRKETSHEDL